MRRHSPYNYAFDNPVYFIDPDGMAPDKIIIGSIGKNRTRTLNNLQKLSSDKLAVKASGEVYIVSKGNGSNPKGTELISGLIKSDHEHTVGYGNENKTVATNKGDSHDSDIGSGSEVTLNPSSTGEYENELGDSVTSSEEGTLAHELTHASHIDEGVVDTNGSGEYDTSGALGQLSNEEVTTRKETNKILDELKQDKREVSQPFEGKMLPDPFK